MFGDSKDGPAAKPPGLPKSKLSFLIDLSLTQKARAAFNHLVTTKRKIDFYSLVHPASKKSLDTLFISLQHLLKHEEKATFRIFRGEVYFKKRALKQESLTHHQFIEECEGRGIGSITFLTGLELAELTKLIELLNSNLKLELEEGGLIQELLLSGVTHIVLDPVSASFKYQESITEEFLDRQSKAAKEAYFAALEAMKNIASDVRLGREISIKKAELATSLMVDNILPDKYPLIRLSTLKNPNEYTLHHSVNVMILSLALGSMLPLNKTQLHQLGLAAILHDVGKINLSANILQKPGPLSNEECRKIQRHPLEGADILLNLDTPEISRIAMTVAFEHHLGYDLKGYPKISKKRKIHLYSRITAVADWYDALTTDRIYREAYLPDEALALMFEHQGTTFDPRLFKTFVQMIGLYPIGTVVEMDSREVGIVFQPNPDNLIRPQVKIVLNKEEEIIPPQIVNLTETNSAGGKFKRTIIQSLDPQTLHLDITQYL